MDTFVKQLKIHFNLNARLDTNYMVNQRSPVARENLITLFQYAKVSAETEYVRTISFPPQYY